MDGIAKCPSCTIDLGNGTSLLASKLVEAVKHECEHAGCKEMVAFLEFEQHKGTCSFRLESCNHPGCDQEVALKDFETHKQFCLFRPVRCPESSCEVIRSISQMELHLQHVDTHVNKENERENGSIWVTREHMPGLFRTSTIVAHRKRFFLKINHTGDLYFAEIVMMGTEVDCEDFIANITVLDKNMKDFASMSSHPRPLDKQAWGTMGLTLSKKDFLKIKLPESRGLVGDLMIKITISKL